MKKVFFGLVVAVLFSFSSCNKSYTCNCSGGTTNPPPLSVTKATKADASSACQQYETNSQTAYPSTRCAI